MAGLFLLLIIFVPLIAVGYNTALAMRMHDAKHRHIGTLVIGFVPWLATVWVFSIGYVVSNTGMSGSAHFAVSLAMYFAVLTSLWAHIDGQNFATDDDRPYFKSHAIACFCLTAPSILSVYLIAEY